MIAEGVKLFSKNDLHRFLDRKDRRVTIKDAVDSRWEVTDAEYYNYHSHKLPNKYKIVYHVQIPFSES